MSESGRIGAIHLKKVSGCAVVSIEVDGKWIDLITSSMDGEFSHIAESAAIDNAILWVTDPEMAKYYGVRRPAIWANDAI